MGFQQEEAEKLLSATGRRCCICGLLHNVQLHHIVPEKEEGRDDIDNAIPLCPNCHDNVHASHIPGRTTRSYTANELKLHRQRTIESVHRGTQWVPVNYVQEKDIAPLSRPIEEEHPNGYRIIWNDRLGGFIEPTPPSDAIALEDEVVVESISHHVDSNAIAFWLEDGRFGTIQIHKILRGSAPKRWKITSFCGPWRVKNLTMKKFEVVQGLNAELFSNEESIEH
jgi:hypothetical protein